MLVWNAMPSMIPMMSAILREAASIWPMVPTTSRTALPPRAATSLAPTAMSAASRALCELRFTVEASSSIEAAVCAHRGCGSRCCSMSSPLGAGCDYA
jgi:hypothetical protein